MRPACRAPWRRLVERERVPTRPGRDSKVYVDPVGSPYARHNGSVIGNRDPTDMDDIADLVLNTDIGPVMTTVAPELTT